MKTWSFYKADGTLLARRFSGPEGMLAINTPQGCTAIEGVHDYLCRRVNVATGEVEPYQPPKPADDEHQTWAWDAQTERWLATPTVAARRKALTAPLVGQIEAVEAQQARALREAVLALAAGKAPPASAVQRLADIEQAVVPLRLEIQAVSADARTVD